MTLRRSALTRYNSVLFGDYILILYGSYLQVIKLENPLTLGLSLCNDIDNTAVRFYLILLFFESNFDTFLISD